MSFKYLNLLLASFVLQSLHAAQYQPLVLAGTQAANHVSALSSYASNPYVYAGMIAGAGTASALSSKMSLGKRNGLTLLGASAGALLGAHPELYSNPTQRAQALLETAKMVTSSSSSSAKLARFALTAGIIGGGYYTATNTNLLSHMKNSYNTMKTKYPTLMKVAQATAVGTGGWALLQFIQPGAGIAENTLKLGAAFAAVVATLAQQKWATKIVGNPLEDTNKNIEDSVIKKISRSEPTMKFSDLADGSVIPDAEVIVARVKNPEIFNKFLKSSPRGFILSGKPGVGKSILVEAIAGELGLPYFRLNASEMQGVYIASGVRAFEKLFADVAQCGGGVVFIDELHNIGKSQNESIKTHGSKEDDKVISTLLKYLEGPDRPANMLVFGATNFPEEVDEALRRPGRFDKIIHISKPNPAVRMALFKKFFLAECDHSVLDSNINYERLADLTSDYTPAEIKQKVIQIAQQAALEAIHHTDFKINQLFVEKFFPAETSVQGVGAGIGSSTTSTASATTTASSVTEIAGAPAAVTSTAASQVPSE